MVSLRRWAINNSISLSVVAFALASYVGCHHLFPRPLTRGYSQEVVDIVQETIQGEIRDAVFSLREISFDADSYTSFNDQGEPVYDLQRLTNDLILEGHAGIRSRSNVLAGVKLIEKGRQIEGLYFALE